MSRLKIDATHSIAMIRTAFVIYGIPGALHVCRTPTTADRSGRWRGCTAAFRGRLPESLDLIYAHASRWRLTSPHHARITHPDLGTHRISAKDWRPFLKIHIVSGRNVPHAVASCEGIEMHQRVGWWADRQRPSVGWPIPHHYDRSACRERENRDIEVSQRKRKVEILSLPGNLATALSRLANLCVTTWTGTYATKRSIM